MLPLADAVTQLCSSAIKPHTLDTSGGAHTAQKGCRDQATCPNTGSVAWTPHCAEHPRAPVWTHEQTKGPTGRAKAAAHNGQPGPPVAEAKASSEHSRGHVLSCRQGSLAAPPTTQGRTRKREVPSWVTSLLGQKEGTTFPGSNRAWSLRGKDTLATEVTPTQRRRRSSLSTLSLPLARSLQLFPDSLPSRRRTKRPRCGALVHPERPMNKEPPGQQAVLGANGTSCLCSPSQ